MNKLTHLSEQFATLQSMLLRLCDVVEHYGVSDKLVAAIGHNAERYGASFLALQNLYYELGLTANSG